MEQLLSLITLIEHLFTNYGLITIILSVFFLGELAVIATFALSANGFIAPHLAMLYTFLGTILIDIFWFYVAEYVLRKKFEEKLRKKSSDKNFAFLTSLIDKHFFVILLFIKFLMGMRLILTLYIVLKTRIPFYKKIVLDSIGAVLFIAVLFPIGWSFGKGMSSLFEKSELISQILTSVTLLIVFIAIFPHVILFLLKKVFNTEKSPQKKLAMKDRW